MYGWHVMKSSLNLACLHCVGNRRKEREGKIKEKEKEGRQHVDEGKEGGHKRE